MSNIAPDLAQLDSELNTRLRSGGRWIGLLRLARIVHLPPRLLWAVLLLFVLVLVVTATKYLTSTPRPIVFKVQGSTRFVERRTIGVRYTVVASNNTRRDIDIVGANATCGPRGCTYIRPLPVTVPPLGRAELEITQSRQISRRSGLAAGDCDVEVSFYVNDKATKFMVIPLTLPIEISNDQVPIE